MTRRLTIIESPLSNRNGRSMDENLQYLRLALRDSWDRGELPFASHGFFPFFLNEHDPDERQEGIEAGYEFWDFTASGNLASQPPFHWDDAPLIVFYLDHGMSTGMTLAMERAIAQKRIYATRTLTPREEQKPSPTQQGSPP